MKGRHRKRAKAFVDRSNWMGDLCIEIRDEIPLSNLSIPGTHNSFTYSLDKKSPIGPDSSEWLVELGKYLPLIRPYIYRWSKCQDFNVQTQLSAGARYFDIRLAVKSVTELRVIHALYGAEIGPILKQIRDFLQFHSEEVVILDFQHLYDFSADHYTSLEALIDGIFGKWICSPSEPKDKLTLSYLKSKDIRVVVIYPLNKGRYWTRGDCLNPWANTTSATKLVKFLSDNLPHRDPNRLYVSQGILTADAAFIVQNLLSSIRKSLAPKAASAIIHEWLPSVSNSNIVILDFAGDYPGFIDAIMSKNHFQCRNFRSRTSHFV
uniref:Phosphatidylinositol-specific phospholipase C X domain-containing protein 3 n=1 Tax=Caligus clemensi TaxID=344056 RepID=C1C3A9_CALCM|nr:Phosphatidylinositol-specific phospholipase C X domain-containing protein 3 [Caligus clemensi]